MLRKLVTTVLAAAVLAGAGVSVAAAADAGSTDTHVAHGVTGKGRTWV